MSPPRGAARGSSGADVNWPTLEEQFASAHVMAGTALEQLIRDNQDFDMLRPDELDDTLGYPPWLRVFWRKRHPDGNYSANDASGGYPLALGEIYHSMLRDQDWPGTAVFRPDPEGHDE
jgi:hypothetical protein